ncbi:MAG: hypothetical protein Q4G65_06390, partial [bacterium]|nr:hypothetical protein [bacterium]
VAGPATGCPRGFAITSKVIDDLHISVGDVKEICEFIMSYKINSCKVEIVSVDENAKVNNGRWVRGHRPACWE